MQTSRRVRLLRNGRNQVLRIPREFELECSEAILHKEGEKLIIEPLGKKKLIEVLVNLEPLDEPFPDVDEALTPVDDIRL